MDYRPFHYGKGNTAGRIYCLSSYIEDILWSQTYNKIDTTFLQPTSYKALPVPLNFNYISPI